MQILFFSPQAPLTCFDPKKTHTEEHISRASECISKKSSEKKQNKCPKNGQKTYFCHLRHNPIFRIKHYSRKIGGSMGCVNMDRLVIIKTQPREVRNGCSTLFEKGHVFDFPSFVFF